MLFWYVLKYLKNKGVVSMIHKIDTSADPFLPPFEGWKVEYHKRDGILDVDPEKILFYLSELQKSNSRPDGHVLRKELEGLTYGLVLNANVGHYFHENMKFIPKEWTGREWLCKRIYFWGTIYRSNDNLYVTFFYWNGLGWDYDYELIDMTIKGPAAVLALV